jgi:hypothetical protein
MVVAHWFWLLRAYATDQPRQPGAKNLPVRQRGAFRPSGLGHNVGPRPIGRTARVHTLAPCARHGVRSILKPSGREDIMSAHESMEQADQDRETIAISSEADRDRRNWCRRTPRHCSSRPLSLWLAMLLYADHQARDRGRSSFRHRDLRSRGALWHRDLRDRSHARRVSPASKGEWRRQRTRAALVWVLRPGGMLALIWLEKLLPSGKRFPFAALPS